MGGARRKGLTADYAGASPEDVARALHAHRPGASGDAAGVSTDGFTKPWLRLDIKRNELGIPIVAGITEHDERPPPS